MFNRIEIFSFFLTLIVVLSEIYGLNKNQYDEIGNRGKTIKRKRRSIRSIHNELGLKQAQFMYKYSFRNVVNLVHNIGRIIRWIDFDRIDLQLFFLQFVRTNRFQIMLNFYFKK